MAPTPWWKNASIYQIYPASFQDSNGDGIGDLPGIISRLDYIQSLGVDAIWVCPMYDSPQYDMGYDISDYEAVYAPYGKVADVEALIAGCHARGLRILLDLVINHTSHEHAWFRASRSSRTDPKRDWYIWRPPRYDPATRQRQPPNNWRSFFGGSAWAWDEPTQEYYLHLFAPQQPDLNWENPATRQALYASAMEFWLQRGIDGFRVDTVNMYSKPQDFPDAPILDPSNPYQPAASLFCNGPRMPEFLTEINQVLRKYRPHGDAITVGELPATPDRSDVLRYVSAAANQLSMVFQFDIVDCNMGADLRFNTVPHTWTLSDLRARVAATQTLMDGSTDGWSTAFLENHDQARCVSRWGSPGKHWEKSAKMLAMLVASLSGTLFLYQGQEIGMTNAPNHWDVGEYKDVDSVNYYRYVQESTDNDPVAIQNAKQALDYLARDHARLPMQWSAAPQAGFTDAEAKPWMRVHDNFKEVNVKGQTDQEDSVLGFWKALLGVRKQFPGVFAAGVYRDVDPENEEVLVFEKLGRGEKLVVTLNFGTEVREVQELEGLLKGKSWRVLVGNYEGDGMEALRPYEGRIYLVDVETATVA
ncbi:glycoside hydrolase family 13 protein [Aspergillus saccharolyticus JOP 1030-1]|uniref:Maltase n=1 Tax=Aspergillus saccharolyticus JOP 1030-1 TaxID=1450539 RepID=A0A318ZVF0_9EURO|nr:maltase [Aspergillus saccharolyticus JOP 1030-1]PYH48030.1 maltase [Aspergillus saccharolyticus JOP 1030-1]